MKKRIVCYSGGHSSGLVAIEVVRKYGKENVILLNHDINPRYENEDIKRFKREVAGYLGLPIIYANVNKEEDPEKLKNQFEVCEEKGSFVNPANRQILCTYVLKTKPFQDYLKQAPKQYEYIIYYGFDEDEPARIDRRKTILNDMGFDSDFPLALWGEGKFKMLRAFYDGKKVNFESVCKAEGFKNRDHFERTIFDTIEVGIKKPNVYDKFKHANCIGCLKAGQQHWYIVYCVDYETFERGKISEERINHSFGKEWLKNLEPKFKKMKEIGIPANEHIPSAKFWKSAKHYLKQSTQDLFPCECFI